MRSFRQVVPGPLVVLAIAEFVALYVAPTVADHLLLPDGPPPPIVGRIVYAVLIGIAMLGLGLYSPRQRAKFSGVLLRVVASVPLGSTAQGFLAYLFPVLALGRGEFVLAAPVSIVAIVALRAAFERIVDGDLFKRRILVFGAGRRAASISQLRRRSDQRGFRVVGFVISEGDRNAVPSELLVVPGGPLLAYCTEQRVDEIVIAMDDRRRAFPVHELLECRLSGIEVIELVDFLERETGKVRLDVLNPSWIIFAPGFRQHAVQQFSERAFDVLASLLLLAIVWPLILLAVIAIKIEDGLRAPVLYRQTRVGLDGRHFAVVKLRSMRVDAERGGKAVWATKGDARVTRVGSLMRKTRIDELPQLFTVLRGDMSFVGPRPERPEFVAELEQRIPYYRERHAVKPGITGWAQLCYPYGASEHDATEKLQYDLYYVKNHSLVFDLLILIQTAEVVLLGKGAR